MIDLARLERMQMIPRPYAQLAVGWAILMPNFTVWPGVDIRVEGWENVPDEPVYFAMNHTDRFNYWPFQYRIWRDHDRFTSAWVKGKYFENPAVGAFMEAVNTLPTVSRGYLISKDFLSTIGRPPTTAEYTHLRDVVDAVFAGETIDPHDVGPVPPPIYTRPRNPLGRAFTPGQESYPVYINALFARMMERFVALNREAFEAKLDVIVFPQGTRSKRLSRGHLGLAEMALHLGRTVVPVGCNGSDRVYPSGNPFARRGQVVYRIGEPIRPTDAPELMPPEPFAPFTPDAEIRHRHFFLGYIERVMGRINDQLDPEYQFGADLQSDGVQGTERFL